jgi:uncharacterized membrane protein
MIWQINIAAVLLAILPLPYLYYMALRLLVSGSAIFLFFRHSKRWQNQLDGWKWMLLGVAVIYNPIIPIHLPKLLWVVINIATAIFFYRHYQLDPYDELDVEDR